METLRHDPCLKIPTYMSVARDRFEAGRSLALSALGERVDTPNPVPPTSEPTRSMFTTTTRTITTTLVDGITPFEVGHDLVANFIESGFCPDESIVVAQQAINDVINMIHQDQGTFLNIAQYLVAQSSSDVDVARAELDELKGQFAEEPSPELEAQIQLAATRLSIAQDQRKRAQQVQSFFQDIVGPGADIT